MWQGRYKFLACFCWLVMTDTTESNSTVFAMQGSQSIISCPLSSIINNTQWLGPPGDIPYNLPGTTILNVDEIPADFLSRLAVDPKTGALIINNTMRSDDNWYMCKVLSNLTRVKLTVLVSPQPPFIANTLKDNGLGRLVVWAIEESQVSLVCQIKGGNPQPSVKWIRGGMTGSEITANTSVQLNTNGTYDVTSTATLMANRSEDRVTYICQGNHTTWTSPQNASLELYLYIRPRHPVLSEQEIVQEGGNMSVKCSITGCRPVANLIWNGLQGQQRQTNTWIPEDETYNVTSLYTTTVSRQDNGVLLQCIVAHTALESSLTVSTILAVWFPPANVSITNNREVTAVRDTLTLICTTGTSNPIADIIWSNSTNAPNGELSTKMEQSGAYGGKIQYQNLTITPTCYMDGNIITCSAQNSKTTAQRVSDSVILNVMFSPIVKVTFIPNMTATEGDGPVTVRCSASSKPISYFTLRKEGLATVISEGQGSQDNHHEYIIQRINRTYAGIYSCTANNSVVGPQNEVKATVELVVLYPPLVAIESRNGSYNETGLMIKCSAHGVPAEYSYRLTHSSLFSGTEIRQVSYELITADVIIHRFSKPSYMDTGIYTCTVNNGILDYRDGSFDESVSDTVWIKGPPTWTSREISFSAEIGHSGRLVIEFYNSLMDPQVTWYKLNGGTLKTLRNSDKYNITLASVMVNVNFYSVHLWQPGFKTTLEVRNVMEQDFSLNQVHLQNYAGDMSPLILELRVSESKPQYRNNAAMDGLIIGCTVGSTVFVSIVVVTVGVLLYRKRNAFNKDNYTKENDSPGSMDSSTGKTECPQNNENDANQYLELQHIDVKGGETVRSSVTNNYEMLSQKASDQEHAYSSLLHGDKCVYENTSLSGNSVTSNTLNQGK